MSEKNNAQSLENEIVCISKNEVIKNVSNKCYPANPIFFTSKIF